MPGWITVIHDLADQPQVYPNVRRPYPSVTVELAPGVCVCVTSRAEARKCASAFTEAEQMLPPSEGGQPS